MAVQAPSAAEAIAFVRGYDGSFGFLQDMRARAEAGQYFTPNMIAAIARCKAREERPAAPVNTDPAREPGMYRLNGEIVKVQHTRDGQRLYALKLVEIGGKRLRDDDGTVVHFEFQYAPGVIRQLHASDLMTLDEARQFGIRFGVCCVCGTFLKDAKSVRNGIGPVCAKKFGWRR